MQWSIWIRLSDPIAKASYEFAVPLGNFSWIESAWMTPDSEKEKRDDGGGFFDARKQVFYLRPRTAQKLLQEFIPPLAAKVKPDAEALWIREGSFAADRQRAETQGRLEKKRKTYSDPWERIDELSWGITGARLLLERKGARSLFSTVVNVWRDWQPITDAISYRWEWKLLIIANVTGSEDPSDEIADRVVGECVSLNPEWLTAAAELMERQWKNYRPDDTWPLVDFDAYHGQAWRSGEMLEHAVNPNGVTDHGQYAPPPAEAKKRKIRETKGFINAVVEALVLGDAPFGSGIEKLEPFAKGDSSEEKL